MIKLKFAKVLVCILALFFLTACSAQGEGNTGIENQVTVNKTMNDNLLDEATTIPLDNDFYNIINNNPIDNDFTWEDIGTENRISRACEYRDIWMIEIENTLNLLKEYLTEDDYNRIDTAYDGWKQYIDNTLEVERSVFYVGSEYAGISKVAGDSLTYPRVMEIAAVRTRNYAIELMSLEYAFTNDVDFIYGQ